MAPLSSIDNVLAILLFQQTSAVNTSFIDEDYMTSLLNDLDLDRDPAVVSVMNQLSLKGTRTL
jgi:hypothetical protein